MRTKATAVIIIIGFIITVISCFIAIAAIDAPHNASNNISCGSCHGETLMNSPFWGTGTYDQLCLSCHRRATGGPYSQTDAPAVTTHYDSSGSALAECRDCHNPHYQRQKVYKNTDASNLYLATGKITSCEYSGKDPLTNKDISTFHYSDNPPITYKSGTGWDATKLSKKTEDYRGAILFPHVNKLGYNYPITAVNPTAKTITVNGNLTTECNLFSSATFAVMYGQYIKDVLNTKTVKFFDKEGINSFADGDTTYNSVCEVCHTKTTHFMGDGTGTDQLHTNVGSVAGTDCTVCHYHINGFAHGGGGGTGCIECHGHDAGYEYETGKFSQGKGTYKSHSTHTENDSDDLKGPNIGCNGCHDINNFPYFKSGTDSNGDGKISLSETDVCNACHSPSGTYDGLNAPVFGAKANWASGAYESDSVTLKAGKEKWCAGCHDESPSVIGVPAPNIVGDEDGAYTYGTGWGYYKTGHGLVSSSTYAASGGRTYGAGKECANCHDLSTSHIDGNARTYSSGSNNYQAGYRLKSVGGKKPMNIPRPTNNIPLVADDFRLCFSCHDANRYLLQSPSPVMTSFRDDRGDPPSSGDAPPISAHNHHLDNMGLRFDSDWNGSYDSQISCVNCHNVHGSTQLSMIRDGKLVGREPGLQIYYAKDGVTTYNQSCPTTCPSTFPPNPPNNPVTLDQSDGTVWAGSSPGNICSDCHGGNYGKYYRTPPSAPQAPVLSWTGETGYVADGVEPNSSLGSSYFFFRIKYSDANYQIPRVIQVWVDTNDNGTYEDSEKFDMQDADPADVDCSNGKRYRKTMQIARMGDGNINYRFYASDGALDATGSPTGNSTLSVTNNAPVLSWTGESGYTADGVNPDSGLGGSNFTFRIKYTDADNNAPTAIQVWIDENDNGSYEAGEKYSMTAVDTGDATYSDGKLYTVNRNIAFAGDGSLNYRFYASDGTNDATGAPITSRNLTVTAANTAPTLTWTGETNYTRDGVNPDSDTGGSSFTFRVKYTDRENNPPSVVQVWVDENDNGTYEDGEKYTMTAVDAGDTEYTDGKLYTKTLTIASAGDGIMNYRFYASDGTFEATGDPTADSFITILINALKVNCLGGVGFYSTIQAAVNAASNGDTVLVSDCIYYEKVTVDNKDITIKSVDGAAVTIIDGGGAGGSVVKFQNGADSTLNGFTLRNGAGGGAGGGIYISSSSPTILNSIITNNDADNGAGIYLTTTGAAIVTINNSTISNNTTSALEGGGLYLGSGGSAVITGSTFNNNQGRYGGGIYLTTSVNASLAIIDSAFNSNRGTLSGGAIYVTASGGTVPLTITNSTFSNNDANDNGGALFITPGGAAATLTITGSTFSGNNTTTQGSALDGGAIYFTSISSTSISGSAFTNNTGRKGGALYIVNSGVNTLSIVDSVFNGNSAAGLQGGGIYLDGGAGTYTATVERTTFAGNTADDNGGGVYITGGIAATFTNCMVTGNKALTLDGGGMHLTGATTAPTIINSTIAGNSAAFRGGGICTYGGPGVTLKNSILWNNADSGVYADIFGPATAAYSDIWQPGFSGSNNISSDPLFINPVYPSEAPTTSGNYHLLADSPAMDAGTTTGAPADDIDGNIRPIGPGIDMGADEIVTVANNAPLLTWTGETGFTADGVTPDIGASGASFEFRVNYSDSDNNAPSSIQVWADANDNGIYEAGEKYTMTAVDAGDTNYADGKLYTKSLNLAYAGDGVIKYRFYAADSYSVATGQPTSDKTVMINNAPTLDWIGSGNFTSDGVHPNSATSGSSFEFRVKYTDTNNNPPTSIQVWVDKNDDGDYNDTGEKITMNAVDAGDTTYTDGKEYTKTMTLTKAGDFNLNYRFYASDGSVATGAPTSNSTVSVTNNVPTLNWTGETNYTNDGVDPNSAIAGSSFTFRVKYTDLDNEAPTVYQVWVDADNSGTYESGEKYDMTAVDPGDTTYTDGKLYTKTLTLNTAGSIKYKFVFNDGSDAATGTPASDSTVTVTGSNTPPVLDWTGETGYTSDGVNPDSYSGGTPFTFRVKYTDAENTAPTSIQVWIDENDNSSYEAGEKYNMTAVDPGDTVYSDGKLYTLTRVLNYAGDGVLNYRFYAHDGIDAATGVATSDKTVTVVNPCRVPSGFATIQAAINSVSPACTYILVSDGTYSENISYADKSITIVSVNGAALTKIQGLTTGTTAVVTFGTTVTVSSGVLDGFTIDNQATTTGANTRGISVGSNDSPTIKNCIIEGNNISGGGANGAGISINGGTATIENTTIGTSGKPNSSAGANGAAIYATALSGPLSISNSTIAYNTANLSGGAIYLTGSSSQTTTLTNVTLSNNTATGTNGGAIWSDGPITISGGAITGNSADDNGGAIYLTGASATLNITGTTITGNSTATAATGGGAIYALNSPALTISGATIDSNTGKIGGGLYLTGVTGTSTFTNTSISSNISSTGHAGGIYSNSALSLNNCTINNNTVTDASSDGGGLYLTGGSATITGGTVSGNSSRNGAGIYMQTSSTLNATGTTINYNTGNSAGSGGGIYDSGSTANVTKCNIKGNRVGTDGGGIYNTSGTMTVTSSVITGNTADQQTTNSDGGGIFAGGTTYIYSSTIAGNYATGTGGGLKVTSGTTVTNSIIHSNTSGGAGPNISGSPTVTYTDVQGGFAGAGNIDATPQFINLQQASSGSPTTLGNYHLCNAFGDPDVACTASSPCIDTASATNAPADDIDGQARPYDVAGKGIEGANAYDMGADEYVP